MRVSQDGSKKVFIGHNGVLYIVQVLPQKYPLLFLWIGQVVSKFLADDEPLAGSVKVSIVLFLRHNRQPMDAMNLVVAFHKIIPNGFGGPLGFEDNVHEIGIDGIFRKCVPNPLVADNWIRRAGHMNEMRKIYIVTVDVIQYLQRGIHHAK